MELVDKIYACTPDLDGGGCSVMFYEKEGAGIFQSPLFIALIALSLAFILTRTFFKKRKKKLWKRVLLDVFLFIVLYILLMIVIQVFQIL